MGRLCDGVFGGAELEPGVFHTVDTPLLPICQERVDDDADRDDHLRRPRRQEIDPAGLDH